MISLGQFPSISLSRWWVRKQTEFCEPDIEIPECEYESVYVYTIFVTNLVTWGVAQIFYECKSILTDVDFMKLIYL